MLVGRMTTTPTIVCNVMIAAAMGEAAVITGRASSANLPPRVSY